MSKYTTELRYIIENYNDNETSDNASSDEFITKALPKLFNFSFPIYDENYRTVLELKIVRHFYTREICCETVGRWKMFLRDRLNIIMPYYNELYKSTTLEFNPLYNTDITTTFSKKGSGDNKENTNGTTNSNGTVKNNNVDWSYISDTPQGGIEGLDSLKYLSSANKITNDDTQTSTLTSSDTNAKTSNFTNTEDYTKHVLGNSGHNYSELLLDYRKTLINIDEQIINELDDLFFLLW